jgi:DNA-binding IclR family transcriptional regulator
MMKSVKDKRGRAAPAGQEKSSRDERRGIQSIELGFALIRELSKAPGKLPLKALAASANMSPSKAHLYLVSFLRLGLVAQDAVTARYGLGPAAIQLGIAAINQLNVVDVAHKHLEVLLESTGVSVSLSIWGNRGPTIIFRLDGQLPVPMSVRVGFVLPLLSTATGRIFMSYLPEREWRSIANAEESLAPGRFARALQKTEACRRLGIALTDSETHEGFLGISAPVFSSDNTLCAAVTALGLSAQVDLQPMGPVATAIREAARRISRDLGASVPEPPETNPTPSPARRSK